MRNRVQSRSHTFGSGCLDHLTFDKNRAPKKKNTQTNTWWIGRGGGSADAGERTFYRDARHAAHRQSVWFSEISRSRSSRRPDGWGKLRCALLAGSTGRKPLLTGWCCLLAAAAVFVQWCAYWKKGAGAQGQHGRGGKREEFLFITHFSPGKPARGGSLSRHIAYINLRRRRTIRVGKGQ